MKTRHVCSSLLFALLIPLTISACGTKPAKDFGGRWKPVNRFDSAPSEIPLYSSYVYQAAPTDRTLKKMLERWAKDNALKLEYRLLSDYTLHRGVASINTADANQAAHELTNAYAAQSIAVQITADSIVVSVVGSTPQSTGDAG